MLRVRLVIIFVGMLVAFSLPGPLRAEAPTAAERIEHGEYLVLHVAMCVQCHTPRDQQGRLDETRLLQGAPMPVTSPYPASPRACRAPWLAGRAGWSDEDAITFLQTGKRADGRSPNPPMPPFRLATEDATAIVAYLRSLPSGR